MIFIIIVAPIRIIAIFNIAIISSFIDVVYIVIIIAIVVVAGVFIITFIIIITLLIMKCVFKHPLKTLPDFTTLTSRCPHKKQKQRLHILSSEPFCIGP